MFHSGDDIGAIVADIGSTSCRIGLAGDDMPKAYFPTVRLVMKFYYILKLIFNMFRTLDLVQNLVITLRMNISFLLHNIESRWKLYPR